MHRQALSLHATSTHAYAMLSNSNKQGIARVRIQKNPRNCAGLAVLVSTVLFAVRADACPNLDRVRHPKLAVIDHQHITGV